MRTQLPLALLATALACSARRARTGTCPRLRRLLWERQQSMHILGAVSYLGLSLMMRFVAGGEITSARQRRQ